jgi:hypothetical protein
MRQRWFEQFCCKFFTRRNGLRRKYQPYRYQPQLEVLEGRALPSTLVVTNTTDTGTSGDGSLRGEIAAAQSGDKIVFADSLQGQTITLTKGELALNQSLDIHGPADNPVIISGSTTNPSRIFDITNSSAIVTLFGLTITQGSITQAPWKGGGILNLGTLTVSNCTVKGNNIVHTALNATAEGGGIFNSGTLTVDHSSLSGNTANAQSFTAFGTNPGTAQGGGIFNSGTLTVSQSSLSGNTASSGDINGTAQGGGIFNSGTGTLDHGTLSGNTAFARNAASTTEGGGIFNSGTLTVSQSSLSGNTANTVGGVVEGFQTALGGGIFNSGTLTLDHSTMSGNSVSVGFLSRAEGGGIFNTGTLTLDFSTITGNTPDDVDNDGTLNQDHSTIGILD